MFGRPTLKGNSVYIACVQGSDNACSYKIALYRMCTWNLELKLANSTLTLRGFRRVVCTIDLVQLQLTSYRHSFPLSVCGNHYYEFTNGKRNMGMWSTQRRIDAWKCRAFHEKSWRDAALANATYKRSTIGPVYCIHPPTSSALELRYI